MLPKLWKSTVQKQFTKLTTGEARAVEVQIRFQGHPGGGGEGEGGLPRDNTPSDVLLTWVSGGV